MTLVPTDGWYAATFHEPGIWCDLYIDVATPGRWDGTGRQSDGWQQELRRRGHRMPAALPPAPRDGRTYDAL